MIFNSERISVGQRWCTEFTCHGKILSHISNDSQLTCNELTAAVVGNELRDFIHLEIERKWIMLWFGLMPLYFWAIHGCLQYDYKHFWKKSYQLESVCQKCLKSYWRHPWIAQKYRHKTSWIFINFPAYEITQLILFSTTTVVGSFPGMLITSCWCVTKHSMKVERLKCTSQCCQFSFCLCPLTDQGLWSMKCDVHAAEMGFLWSVQEQNSHLWNS